MIHLRRICWAMRDLCRGYHAGDITSLRKRLVLAQFGDPDERIWLSPEETRAFQAGQAVGIGTVKVIAVDRGRALMTVRRPDALAPIRRA